MAETQITLLLRAWSQGDPAALQKLTPLVYDELRRLAAGLLRRERRDHTFSATTLVHEAFIRLAGTEELVFEDRVQFFALAARQMRHILVDHARRRAAGKRGGGERPVTLDEALAAEERPEALCALDEALCALAAFDERKARAVELHYFGGMTQREIAAALGVHENTVARDLRLANAWLLSRLKSEA
jgi:RNA polymerase sigma factor (TIGR02999 family)